MQRKVVVKKKIKRHRQSKERRQASKPVLAPRPQLSSYEDALLDSIINKHPSQSVSAQALEFSSLLSSLTQGMREMQRKSGFRAGRSLYRTLEHRKRYIWYEESIADLVTFLESTGLGKVAFNVFPDTVSIRIYNRAVPSTGITTHEFEAGLISGFVSAGRHQLTEIYEARCSRAGSEHCEFTRAPRQGETGVSEEHSISRIIKGTLNALAENKDTKQVPLEYYMLASSTLFRNEYMHALKNIASYIGNEFATELRLSGSRQSFEAAERLTKLLNLGSLTINSLRPVDITLEFEGLSSKREHVELSIAFLDGLLNRVIRDKAKIETLGARSARGYKVKLIEKK